MYIDDPSRFTISAKREKNFDFTLSVFKAIAVFFIINSHMDELLQYGIMAKGEAAGNAMFFFVSGYTLYLSDRSNFLKWEWRRLIRIYPTLWVFMAITFFLGEHWEFVDIIIPKFWFLAAILCFYPLIFAILKFMGTHMTTAIIILYILMIFNCYFLNDGISQRIIKDTHNEAYLHWFVYFPVMLAGAMFSKGRARYNHSNWLMAGVFFYFCCEILFGVIFIPLQCIVAISLVPLAIGMFRVSEIVATGIKGNAMRLIINKIASLSLEIYIVQFIIIDLFARVRHNMPDNIYASTAIVIATYIAIFLAALLLNTLSRGITKKLKALFR